MSATYATDTLTFSDGITYSFEYCKQDNMDQLGRTIYTIHVDYTEDGEEKQWCSSIWDYRVDTKLQYIIRTLTDNNYSSDDLVNFRDSILNSEYKEKTSGTEDTNEASNS